MFENLIVLLIISIIVSTTKESRALGYLIISYYSVYILIDLSEFGVVVGNVFITYAFFERWYLLCCMLSIGFSLWATVIYKKNGGIACLYALILIVDAMFCGVMSISQSFETNILLNVYNNLQDISLYIDLLVVFMGTDHYIKRNFCAASRAIDYINNIIDRWCYLVFKTSGKG